MDEYGFTLVNTNRFIASNEPYVLASPVRQVFHVEDPLQKDWHVVIKIAPYDLHNILEKDLEAHDDVISSQNEAYSVREDEDVRWYRREIPEILIDSSINYNAVEENRGVVLYLTLVLIG